MGKADSLRLEKSKQMGRRKALMAELAVDTAAMAKIRSLGTETESVNTHFLIRRERY